MGGGGGKWYDLGCVRKCRSGQMQRGEMEHGKKTTASKVSVEVAKSGGCGGPGGGGEWGDTYTIGVIKRILPSVEN